VNGYNKNTLRKNRKKQNKPGCFPALLSKAVLNGLPQGFALRRALFLGG